MEELVLTEIWVYPIKSLGGIRVEQAQVMEKGLEWDRRWMLVDENNQFLTQRDVHEMALFKLQFNDHTLTVSFGSDVLHVPLLSTHAAHVSKAMIWDDEVTVVEGDPQHSQWFSDRMKRKCRLVFFPEENRRQIDANYVKDTMNVSLADGYPFLLIGQRSLDDLNRRLEHAVPMNRFRPNFVVAGAEPYAEESWSQFSIGKIQFQGVKPCARCNIPTIDQATGASGKEPIRTLSRYRRSGEKVLFGQNVIARGEGIIRVGEKVLVESFS